VNINLHKIGKSQHDLASMVDEYVKRSHGYNPVRLTYYKTDAHFLKASLSGTCIILDERGKTLSTQDFADFLTHCKADPGRRNLHFVVGGAFGISQAVKDRANEFWRLSEFVLPSDIALLVLSEQIYRSLSILAGSPYHHA
jgi:23S rRNA (pseudouridine1915-N3)-methyltransferase